MVHNSYCLAMAANGLLGRRPLSFSSLDTGSHGYDFFRSANLPEGLTDESRGGHA
jgi:hypothetical protein